MSSRRDELLKDLKKLKEFNLNELEYLKKSDFDEKYLLSFSEKKIKYRITIENHLKESNLNIKDKQAIKEEFLEILELEKNIEKVYKEKLQEIQKGLFYINRERKLRETYGKGGMTFLSEKDKNLKK